jgi:hypothetical protein
VAGPGPGLGLGFVIESDSAMERWLGLDSLWARC